jgi:hypothetical protein
VSVIQTDGVFKSELSYCAHEDRLYRRLTQVNEDAILEQNARRRVDDDQLKMEWARMVGDVPSLVWHNWCRKYPELTGGPREARDRTLLRLLRENPQYTVVPRSKL